MLDDGVRQLLPVLILSAACGSVPPEPEATPGDPAATTPGYDDGSALADLGFRQSQVGPDVGYWARIVGGGVVAADLDADGFDDLFFPQAAGANALYWGQGDGTFVADASLAFDSDVTVAASTADADGDGRLDLLLLGQDVLRLFLSAGDRTFAETAMPPVDGVAATSAWGDLDLDGDLDLFVGVYAGDTPSEAAGGTEAGRPNLWLLNDGAATFEPLPPPPGSDGAPLHALFRDFDHDGRPDLLQVNDFGLEGDWNTMLWMRDGEGGWIDRASELGIGLLEFPMGALHDDLDGDGVEDLWFSNIGATRVFQGLAEGGWVEVSGLWGAALPSHHESVSWSVLPVDPDGDGRPGVYVTYGPMSELDHVPDDPDVYFDQPDRLLVPTSGADDAPSPFAEAPAGTLAGRLDGNHRGVAEADLNSDGVPDLVVGAVNGEPLVLLGRPGGGRRLAVELRDPASPNGFAIGARVTVEAGGRTWSRELGAGGRGSQSGEGPVLWFAVGDAGAIDGLAVAWPGGGSDVFDVDCVDCRIVLTRP